MLKKFLLTIFFISIFIQAAFAQEIFKITSVNLDTSHSLIFLASPDNTTEAIMKNIKLVKLQSPKRVYFDINSAVLNTSPQNWFLNSGGVKQVKINQIAGSTNKVRVMLYLDENFDQSKIRFLKLNNNIVINYKNGLVAYKNEYFQNTYRDDKASSSDFYENLSISNEDLKKLKTATIEGNNNDSLTQIQDAFNLNKITPTSTSTSASSTKTIAVKNIDVIKKELKLKSRYYLNSLTPQKNGFLISGFGAIGFEKPLYLTNPARAVFDIPNAIISPELKNQELKIGQDTIKIGQYGANKARVVITSNQLEKYFPIFAADGQSVLFSNSENVDTENLFSKTNDAVSYYVRRIGGQKLPTDEFIIGFNAPVVHSVRRDNSKLTINFYNTLRYNDKNFKTTVNNSDLNEMTIDLLPKVGLKLTLPLERNEFINCYMGADGKSVRIVIKGINQKKQLYTYTPEKLISLTSTIIPHSKGKHSVVLDAGHGGKDYGAIRCGINEKDINLDVIQRIQAILQSKGVTCTLTRSTDDFISLQDRTITTANVSPDIFVSVHVNSSKSTASGIETHYYHPESLELAQSVHTCLASNIKSPDRGLFKSKFYVINHTSVPAILVEIGFISNDEERAELVSENRKNQTAKAIAEGILKYLNRN